MLSGLVLSGLVLSVLVLSLSAGITTGIESSTIGGMIGMISESITPVSGGILPS